MTLSAQEVAAAGLPDWALAGGVLHTRLPLPDWATGLRLVAALGADAEQHDHHPDLDLRYAHLDVHLWSHDAGGVTRRDVRAAGRVSALARAEGVVPDPRPFAEPGGEEDRLPLVTAAGRGQDGPDRTHLMRGHDAWASR